MKPRASSALDLGPGGLTLAALDGRIADLERELASLKRVRAAKIGGEARNRVPRTRRYSDHEIAHAVQRHGGPARGAVNAAARELKVNRKTISRALARVRKSNFERPVNATPSD